MGARRFMLAAAEDHITIFQSIIGCESVMKKFAHLLFHVGSGFT
jgi:hypothetical protein